MGNSIGDRVSVEQAMLADSQRLRELGCLFFENFGYHLNYVGDAEHVLEEVLNSRWRRVLNTADLNVGKL